MPFVFENASKIEKNDAVAHAREVARRATCEVHVLHANEVGNVVKGVEEPLAIARGLVEGKLPSRHTVLGAYLEEKSARRVLVGDAVEKQVLEELAKGGASGDAQVLVLAKSAHQESVAGPEVA